MRVVVLASSLIASCVALGCAGRVCVVHEEVHDHIRPFGMQIERRFSADGRPLSIDEHNQVYRGHTRYRYDARRRLVGSREWSRDEEVSFPHPTELDQEASRSRSSVVYRYDDAGRLVQATRDDSVGYTRTVSYAYTDGRLTAVLEHESRWELSWTGDCLSRAAHVATGSDRPTMLHEYTCDGGRVVEDAFTADFLAHRRRYLFEVDDAGRISTRHRVQERDDVPVTPALAQRFHYDEHGRLRALEAGPASESIPSSEYRYDDAGRVVLHTRGRDQWRFRYGEGCSLAAVRSLQPTVPPQLLAPWWFTGEDWKLLPLLATP